MSGLNHKNLCKSVSITTRAFVFISLLIGIQHPMMHAQVLQTDSLALVRLCQETEGASWKHVWDLNQPVKSWYGVKLDKYGKRVIELDLDKNGLDGILPPAIGELTALQNLNLAHNYWIGTLPKEIGKLQSLVTLNLLGGLLDKRPTPKSDDGGAVAMRVDYGFSGELPKEIGNLSNLKYLYISANQFTGEIPKELSQLKKLNVLMAGRNFFSGPFPKELALCPELEGIDVADNQLSGALPTNWGMYKALVGSEPLW